MIGIMQLVFFQNWVNKVPKIFSFLEKGRAKMKKMVSVIIPSYNAEDYIAVCLDRLIGQTYSELEIIVVNDGSTDSTLLISERFASVYSFVKVINISHAGVSVARNVGIDAAIGDYIVFVDADDYVEPTLIEEYVNAYDTWGNNAAIVICGMKWEDHRNCFAPTKLRLIESDLDGIVEDKYVLKRSKTSLLSWLKLFNFITNKCYKAYVINESRIRFDESISIAEDMKFNIDYLNHATGMLAIINKPLYHYIKHGNDSLSGKYYEGSINDVKNSYKMLLDFTCNQVGVTTDDIYVIKSIYLMDWVSRLCALWDDDTVLLTKHEKLNFANDEIRGIEFKRLLHDSKMGNKITRYRFYTLAFGHFGLFIYLRKFYQWIKGVKSKKEV